MTIDVFKNGSLLRKARWFGACLTTAFCVALSYVVIAADDETQDLSFKSVHELDITVKLIISHRIKVKDFKPGEELILHPQPDETATGSKDYCVITNDSAKPKAKIMVNPVGGTSYVLTSNGKNDVPYEVFIIDKKNGDRKNQMSLNKEIAIAAVSEKNCSTPTTQLFVSANIKGVSHGNYSAKLKMRISAD